MANYFVNNVYLTSDVSGLTVGGTGTFTLSASATKLSFSVTDDDTVLQDTQNNAGTGETLDTSQQTLTNAWNGNAAGSSVRSAYTIEVDVTQPNGTKYTLQMNQYVVGSNTYYGFQYDVPAGSTISVKSWQANGNANYSDLSGGQTLSSHELNQVISSALGQQIISGGATFNRSSLTSIHVNDQDALIEDNNNNVPSGQTRDENIQNLSQAYGGHAAGSYIHSRLYYDVMDTTTGQVGRMYQLRVDDAWNGVSLPGASGEYWAFTGIRINKNSHIVLTNGGGQNSNGDEPYTNFFVCFANGTMIETDRGPRAVEDLMTGDRVLTADRGYQPVRWIGRRDVTAAELTRRPGLRPVRFRAGALGDGMPERDLMVSPQHRMLVRSSIAERMFGHKEVLIAAKQLLALDGVELVADLPEVTYFHLLLDRHEVIFANGAPSESLFLGAQAQIALGLDALRQIAGLFPRFRPAQSLSAACRLIVTGHSTRSLIARHRNIRRAIVAADCCKALPAAG